MIKNNLWFDGMGWHIWNGNMWIAGTPSLEDRVSYLEEQITETNKIADAYFELEELAMDFVEEAGLDNKWKWKFKEALKHLSDF